MKRGFWILESAERTGHVTKRIDLPDNDGLIFFVDVTARDGSATLTPKLTALLPNGATLDLWTATSAIDSADTTVGYAFYPGAEDTDADYTEEVNMVLPASVQLTFTHSNPGGTDGITYSVYGVKV